MPNINQMLPCLLCQKSVFTVAETMGDQLCFDCKAPEKATGIQKKGDLKACFICGAKVFNSQTLCSSCRKGKIYKPKRACLSCGTAILKKSIRCASCHVARLGANRVAEQKRAPDRVVMECSTAVTSRAPRCSGKFLRVWMGQTKCEFCLREVK